MKIQILLSTYNGERHLKAQLNSILNQGIENLYLTVRDDGSQDKTIKILNDYKLNFPQITYYTGTNIGVQRSYLDLISHVDADTDYVAFSDQDDIWLPDKISRAVHCLESINVSQNVPLLYCSAQKIVDEQLRPIITTVSREIHTPSFGNALVQNVCTGCTAVVNRQLILLISRYQPEHIENIIMHDWWIYLVASCFGKVYYDPNAYIKYRQHGRNTHGVISKRRDLIRYRFQQLNKPRGEIYKQIEEFKKCYSELLNKEQYIPNMKMLEKVILSRTSLKNKLKLIADKNIFRQKMSDDLIYRGIILIGKL